MCHIDDNVLAVRNIEITKCDCARFPTAFGNTGSKGNQSGMTSNKKIQYFGRAIIGEGLTPSLDAVNK